MISKLKEKYSSMPVQVRASLWFLLCNFMQKAIGFISTPLFTRLLTEGQYGEYNVFLSWMSIVSIVITLRLSYGVFMQGLVKFEHDTKIYSSSMQGLSLTLVTAWTIIYFIFRHTINHLLNLSTLQMCFMLALIWTTEAFQFWSSEQRVKNKYRLLAALTLIVMFAQPALGMILVILSSADHKVSARILGMLIVNVAAYTWCFFVQMKHGKKFFSRKYWLYALKFNLPLLPHYLSQTVLYGSDRIMISRYINDDAAGIYSLAYSVAMIMTMFNTTLNQVMAPWIYRKIKEKRPQDMTHVMYTAILVVAAANLILILLAPEAISIFAPPGYAGAKWVVPPVALSVFFMYMYDAFAAFQFYYEKSWFIMSASVFGALLNIALNYVFLSPRWFGMSYIAAGYTTLICYIVYSLCHYICMRWVCRKHLGGVRVYDPKVLLGVSACFVSAGLLLTLTYDVPVLRFSFLAVVLVLLFIFRAQVIAYVKKLLAMRKANNEKKEEAAADSE